MRATKIHGEGHLIQSWGSGMDQEKVSIKSDSWMCVGWGEEIVYLPYRGSSMRKVQKQGREVELLQESCKVFGKAQCLVSDETGEVSWGQACVPAYSTLPVSHPSTGALCLDDVSQTLELQTSCGYRLFLSTVLALLNFDPNRILRPHDPHMILRPVIIFSQLTLKFAFLKSVLTHQLSRFLSIEPKAQCV